MNTGRLEGKTSGRRESAGPFVFESPHEDTNEYSTEFVSSARNRTVMPDERLENKGFFQFKRASSLRKKDFLFVNKKEEDSRSHATLAPLTVWEDASDDSVPNTEHRLRRGEKGQFDEG